MRRTDPHPTRRRRPGRTAAAAVVLAALAAGCSGPGNGEEAVHQGAASTTTTTAPAPPLAPGPAALADRTTMTVAGRDLFARSLPELVPLAEMSRRCPIPEETGVLGCYRDRRIVILDLSDPRLDGMEEATAAHELLHAVWDRLPDDERDRLGAELRALYDNSTDPALREKVEAYRRRDPDVVDTELHSILGTEVAVLSGPLEEHYREWFTDRAAVVLLAAAAQGSFDRLEAQIATLDATLDALGDEIAAAEDDLERSRDDLAARSRDLEILRDAGRIDEYNAGVDPFNAAVERHNAAVATQRSRVERYNGTVAVRNALGADYDELVEEITTSASPVGGAG